MMTMVTMKTVKTAAETDKTMTSVELKFSGRVSAGQNECSTFKGILSDFNNIFL